MATVITYVSESLCEDLSVVKFILYAIPVTYCTHLFMKGEMTSFYIWAAIFAIIFLGLMTKAINNVRTNKTEILTLNPLKLVGSIALTAISIIPQFLIFGGIAWVITKYVVIPIDLPHIQLIFNVIVWSIFGSIILTSYLSFAKYLSPLAAFNYKVISLSCIDILINLLFFLPQLLLINFVMVSPAVALCNYFGIPLTHWSFIVFCSIVFVINISMFAGYFAQSSFDHIVESDKSYEENLKLNDVIDDIAERLN